MANGVTAYPEFRKSKMLESFVRCQLSYVEQSNLLFLKHEEGKYFIQCWYALTSASSLKFQPDVVVNCAAISAPRACEMDPAAALSINVPFSLVTWLSNLKETSTLLIQLSTDQGKHSCITRMKRPWVLNLRSHPSPDSYGGGSAFWATAHGPFLFFILIESQQCADAASLFLIHLSFHCEFTLGFVARLYMI